MTANRVLTIRFSHISRCSARVSRAMPLSTCRVHHLPTSDPTFQQGPHAEHRQCVHAAPLASSHSFEHARIAPQDKQRPSSFRHWPLVGMSQPRSLGVVAWHGLWRSKKKRLATAPSNAREAEHALTSPRASRHDQAPATVRCTSRPGWSRHAPDGMSDAQVLPHIQMPVCHSNRPQCAKLPSPTRSSGVADLRVPGRPGP